MDKLSELNQRLADIGIATEFKKREILSCQESLSVERILAKRDEAKIKKLTEQITKFKKEIDTELPEQTEKTKTEIGVAEKEGHKQLVRSIEKECKLAEIKKKASLFLETLRAAEAINIELRELNGNFLKVLEREKSKVNPNELDSAGCFSGFYSLKTLVRVAEIRINREKVEGYIMNSWLPGTPL